jgi:hypothetical protein
MNKSQKQAFQICFKGSFVMSTTFLVDWVNHFEQFDGEDMPSVWAYKAQLKLRGFS